MFILFGLMLAHWSAGTYKSTWSCLWSCLAVTRKCRLIEFFDLIILLAKFHIFKSKLQKEKPNFKIFRHILKQRAKVERYGWLMIPSGLHIYLYWAFIFRVNWNLSMLFPTTLSLSPSLSLCPSLSLPLSLSSFSSPVFSPLEHCASFMFSSYWFCVCVN